MSLHIDLSVHSAWFTQGDVAHYDLYSRVVSFLVVCSFDWDYRCKLSIKRVLFPVYLIWASPSVSFLDHSGSILGRGTSFA